MELYLREGYGIKYTLLNNLYMQKNGRATLPLPQYVYMM
jgi:hypothetical protein